jgi:Tfp pilus assembly protein PilN
MIRINLVGESRRVSASRGRGARSGLEGENIALWVMVAAIAIIGLLYGGYWWTLNGDLRAREVEISEARQRVRELQAVIEEVERFTARRAELEHKIDVIGQLRDNQRGPVRIMDQVSKSLPDLLWLDQLRLTASAVTIDGKAFTTNAVASFIESLERVEEFQEPVLRNAVWDGQIYNFQIVFTYGVVPLRSSRETTEAPASAAR